MTDHSQKLDPRVRELFAEVLERPEPERGAHLDAACGADLRLRAEVLALLQGHRDAEQRFEEDGHASVAEQPGDRIGPYTLLHRLGEGGFGVVWMAEQDVPVRRRVALKVLKPGMDTAQVIGRFEAERQALALMDHPSIAKVFDGGATGSGRPYFVMELVQGVPITRYCDDAGLDPQQRLQLFVPVCQAVQHAHHKGVIHRDLKPGNVLVALHDGVPVPKVIDFGIAKATAGVLTQRTVVTGLRQMLGTPEYMAPEQALGGLDVDTRADIYSLGVLLYELLTGTRPFEMQTLLQEGYDELLRTIREVDPPKPSTRVSTLGEHAIDIARHRRVAPRSLGSLMRGDLDWIVMKAIEKERGRRYQTAIALADDVLRHLRHEPVLAGPPSRRYRWRKYVRRHRIAVTAGAVVALSVVSGAVAAGLGYREATAQAQIAASREAGAKRAAQKAETITSLLTAMLTSGDPHQSRNRDHTVRQVLDDFDRSLGNQLAAEPEVEAAVQDLLARAYRGLGMPTRAEPHAQRSLELRKGLGGDPQALVRGLLGLAGVWHDAGRHAEALALLARAGQIPGVEALVHAEVLALRGDLLRHQGDVAGAETTGRAALQLVETRASTETSTVALCRTLLASALMDARKPAEAEELLRRNLAAAQAAGTRGTLQTATVLANLASAVAGQRRFADAEALAREALRIQEEVVGAEDPSLALNISSLGAILFEGGDLQAAEQELRRALTLHQRHGAADHPDRAGLVRNLTTFLSNRLGQLQRGGDLRGAAACGREAVALLSDAFGSADAAVASARRELASVLLDLGEPVAAEQQLREALDRLSAMAAAPRRLHALCLHDLAAILLDRDLAAAEDLTRKALDLLGPERDIAPALVLGIRVQLAEILRRRGRLQEAETGARAAQDVLRSLPDPGPSRYLVCNALACILKERALGERSMALLDEAIGSGTEALAAVTAVTEPVHPSHGEDAQANLGELLLLGGRLAEAEPLLRSALAAREARLSAGDQVTFARSLLVTVLEHQGRAADALPLARANRDELSRRKGATSPDAEEATRVLGRILGMLGQREAALGLAQGVLTRARAAGPAATAELVASLAGLVITQLELGDFSAAEATAGEFLALRQAQGEGATQLASAEALRGRALAELGRRAEAEALLARACPVLLPPQFFTNHRHRRHSIEALLDLLQARGASAEAAAWRQRLAELPR